MQATGIILILAGAVLVSFKWRNLLKIKNPAKGIKYAIIAAIAYGIDFVIIDLLAKQIGWFLPIFFIGAITAAYMLIFSGTTKKDISFPKNVTWFIILVGILDTVAYLAYSSGVTSEFGSIVAPIGAASPVVAIILAKIFFKENIEMNQITGIVAVILGLILVSL
jgi:drug/metabolite transporter (DMT)-like permease